MRFLIFLLKSSEYLSMSVAVKFLRPKQIYKKDSIKNVIMLKRFFVPMHDKAWKC